MFLRSEFITVNISLLSNFILTVDVYRDLLLGISAVISRILLLGFWEEIFRVFILDKFSFYIYLSDNVDNSRNSSKVEASNPEQGKEVSGGGASMTREQQIQLDLLSIEVKKDTLDMMKALKLWSEELQKYGTLPFDKMDLNKSESIEALLNLLRKQSNILTRSITNRVTWGDSRCANVTKESLLEWGEQKSKMVKIQEDYWAKASKLSTAKDQTTELKEFYAILNNYRNSMIKELNKGESIIIEDIRKSLLYKYPEIRKVVNVESVEIKKEFNNQDSYLKKKVGEIVNSKK